jgi:hypothetical protein
MFEMFDAALADDAIIAATTPDPNHVCAAAVTRARHQVAASFTFAGAFVFCMFEGWSFCDGLCGPSQRSS